MKQYFSVFIAGLIALGAASAQEAERVDGEIPLSNVLPSLEEGYEYSRPDDLPQELPIVVPPFEEHVRVDVAVPDGVTFEAIAFHEGALHALADDGVVYWRNDSGNWSRSGAAPDSTRLDVQPAARLHHHVTGALSTWRASGGRPLTVRAVAGSDNDQWAATSNGLIQRGGAIPGPVQELPVRGVRDVLVDNEGKVWVATSQGLFVKGANGDWTNIRGEDGLPVEDTTCLAVNNDGRLWIGTSRGAIQYRPSADDRQWFYRAGPRYVTGDMVTDIAVAPGGDIVFVLTTEGLGAIEAKTTTLLEKARIIEERLNARHRRLGLVGETEFASVDNTDDFRVLDDANDGLWTGYHVAAMSLCYAATGDEAAKESARTSMEAMYMLQEATGVPGLPARSVVPVDAEEKEGNDWRIGPDGDTQWRGDTSSDEIDGHYLAFYTFWEHIAKDDPELRDRHIKQVREMTDYIVDNGFVLLDVDGERTRWGFWSPELLNDDPENYVENGLNSLQILSFLRTAYHITGDEKYKEHYDDLIVNHGYLDNVLLEKKVFPDELNHSDDQLAYVAWYPLLQLAEDPRVRNALQRAVRRHYTVELPERASFFFFVTATIDEDYVDLEAAVDNLRRIPTDRRNWRMENSHRDDVVFAQRVDRFGKRQLSHVLPVDERHFDRWNANPYIPDEGGDGTREDDGAPYLLPYWMGRYHGFIAEAE